MYQSENFQLLRLIAKVTDLIFSFLEKHTFDQLAQKTLWV